ncbi:hypothetical protein AURDEDRAFT_116193 [Auricularia subglabra TFB-10046 SS5]|nr:hypothetical protein AURDEDRAFT_116193 [Auricularia subglabra TFB-10046 SS5]
MVDWQSPEVVALSLTLCAYSVGIGATIVVWEMLLALPFDVAVVVRRPLSVSSTMYFLARPTMLVVLIPAIRVRTARVRLDCTSWADAVYAAGYISQACASGLLLLRVVAISRNNKWLRSTVVGYYLCSIVLFIYELSQIKFVWSEEISACVVASQQTNLICTVAVAFFDFLCLGSLIYLLRSGIHGSGMWELLHKQGLQWFVCVAFAHTCSTTMLALDLNDPLSELGQGASIVMSTVCATRMYSDLMQYATVGDEQTVSSSHGSSTFSAAMLRFKHRLQARNCRMPAAYPLTVLTDAEGDADGRTQLPVYVVSSQKEDDLGLPVKHNVSRLDSESDL